MGHVSPTITPRVPVRYNGTHIGKIGPRCVPDEESDPMDSVDLFGAILVAETVTELFFDCDNGFDDTQIDD